jgi:hypothetical protein
VLAIFAPRKSAANGVIYFPVSEELLCERETTCRISASICGGLIGSVRNRIAPPISPSTFDPGVL